MSAPHLRALIFGAVSRPAGFRSVREEADIAEMNAEAREHISNFGGALAHSPARAERPDQTSCFVQPPPVTRTQRLGAV
jgi:hypothetical protein